MSIFSKRVFGFSAVVFGILVSWTAVAHTDGIYNPTANSVGDTQGIDSNAVTGVAALACSYTPVTTGTQNVAYTGATPAASGGVLAYTFSETGALPTGLTINSGTGVISGTPSVSGSFTNIQVKVTDSALTVANCGTAFTLTIAPPAFQGPGDVQSGATAFYSCRAYTLALAGTKAYRLVRASDSAQTDINSLPSGLCDTATPATFCNATTCKVVTYYDQTGTLPCTPGPVACDITQSTDANRPVWTASFQNGWPCAVGAGTTQLLSTTTAFALSQPFTFMAVTERTGNFTAAGRVFSSNGGGTTFGYRATINTFGASGGAITATASDSAIHAIINGTTTTASASYIVVDGAAPVTGTLGTLSLSGGFAAMADPGGGTPQTGAFCEGGVWPVLMTTGGASQSANMVTNMRSAGSGWNF